MSEQRAMRVGLVEDHGMVLDGLVAVLSNDPRIEVVGTAVTVEDFKANVACWNCDVVVADYRLSDGKGTDIVPATTAPVLLMSGIAGPVALQDAFRSGCAGFISKSNNVDQLADTVLVVARGGTVYPAEISKGDTGDGRPVPEQRLTARELHVLSLLADTKTVTDISRHLNLSSHTVRNHVRAILLKLGARSQLEAVVIAIRAGIIDVDG